MKMFSLIAMAIAFFITLAPLTASAQKTDDEKRVAQSASPPSAEVKPPSIDPRSLIGKWEGEIVGRNSGTVFYLTFNKVVEDNIFGTFYIHAPWIQGRSRYSNRDVPFVGTIDGGRIKIPGLPEFDLELVDNKIQGKWETDNFEFQGDIRNVKKKG